MTVASVTAPLAHPPLHIGPNTAMAGSTLGILLLFWECNRPGSILPGATGLLLLLLGGHALANLPLAPGALLLLLLAACTLALPFWLSSHQPLTLVGALLLSAALAHLSRSPGLLSPALAASCGVALGLSSGWLARIAGVARRAKRRNAVLRTSADPGRERWE